MIKILTKFRNFRFEFKNTKISEIQILYIAKFLRFFAINLSGGLTFFYFYKIGFGWMGVILALAIVWITKLFASIIGSIYIAKHGPKHGILLSNILAIPMLVLIGLSKDFGLPVMIASMLFWGLSYQIYNLAYYIDFSKVDKNKSSAKHSGNMAIIEKITSLVAPVCGAFLAIKFGAQSAMYVSAIIFALSAIPLLVTREVMKNNIKLDFKNFPFKNHRHNFFAQFMIGLSLPVFVNLWGIFVPIFIFSKDDGYGVIGVLASLSSFFAIIAAWVLARTKGRKVLAGSVLGRGFSMALSVLSFSKSTAIVSNFISEMSGVGYKISNIEGVFSDAEKSGERIEYFMIFESVYVLGAFTAAVIAGVCVLIFGAELGLRIFFAFSAIAHLGGLLFKYPAYEK